MDKTRQFKPQTNAVNKSLKSPASPPLLAQLSDVRELLRRLIGETRHLLADQRLDMRDREHLNDALKAAAVAEVAAVDATTTTTASKSAQPSNNNTSGGGATDNRPKTTAVNRNKAKEWV